MTKDFRSNSLGLTHALANSLLSSSRQTGSDYPNQYVEDH